MSRQTMTDAALKLTRSPIYGLASCMVGTSFMEFEIGWPEFQRDTTWAESVLRRSGLSRGDMVLCTLTNWESPWGSPIVHGLRNLGVTYATAEVFAWDARRVSMFLQRFPIKAIIGLSGQTLAALDDADPPLAQLLDGVDIIWARPHAAGALAEQADRVIPFVRFGPALAMGLPGSPAALVNANEWDVAPTPDGLTISSIAPRATQFRDIATGFTGRVDRIDDALSLHLALDSL
jgi:hypothetical protein